MKSQGQFLKKYYLNFQNKRKSLSQSAFARYLGLSAPRFHDFMNDKRVLSPKLAEQICQRLKLTTEEREKFINVVLRQRTKGKPKTPFLTLSIEEFKSISDWYYFAILALADTIDFQAEPAWVAQRLAIPVSVAKQALSLLTNLGFLISKDGGLVLSRVRVETESDIPSSILRESHKQSLRRVIDEMDQIDVKDRMICSSTIAGDPRKLALAKKMIDQMTEKIANHLESGKRTEVYELNVQLMPISKRSN